jgi:hypothetical protein
MGSTTTSTVTSVTFLDASPLPSDHALPNVPNGHYFIPTDKNAVSSQSCVKARGLSSAWSCMPPIGLGVEIDGQGSNVTMTIDAYPLGSRIQYGAQPPNLERQGISMTPSIDRDSDHLGTSLFFWTYYDKLTICM